MINLRNFTKSDIRDYQSGEANDLGGTYAATRHYIHREIKLHEFDGPIPFGQYVFPFEKKLPKSLPATFAMHTKQLEASIAYSVEADILGATEIKVAQELVVYQTDTNTDTVVSETFELKCGFLPFHRTINVTASLDRDVYYTGETAILRLDTETTGFLKPTISTIDIELQRSVVLEIKRDITGDDAIGKTHTLDMSFLPAVCGRGMDMVVEAATRPVEYISPDGGDTTLHRVHLKTQRTRDSSREMRAIPVRLVDEQAVPIATSTQATFINCIYWLKIDLQVKDSETKTMEFPLACIRKPFAEWNTWLPPDWLFNCQLATSDGECAVSGQVLESDIFSRLPCFQMDD
ncbi:hypothetical protein LSAT2_013086 [Lamellibrachia satsuma]|nr:hypothetical protein LSAT2_013086 [Lamellibrachia satsuma]